MQAQTPEVGGEKATTPTADLRLVSVEQLQKIHRELDACQKAIWLAGCRPGITNGFDPAYVIDAQAQLKVIEGLIAATQSTELNDTARLDFMLDKHRKVTVELIPGRRHEVYVEEGFMSDKQYPAVPHIGDWLGSSAAARGIKRQAIDLAISAQRVAEAP